MRIFISILVAVLAAGQVLADGYDGTVQGTKEFSSQTGWNNDTAGTNWIVRALGEHGSERMKVCVDKAGSFFGLRATGPWDVPDGNDPIQLKEASICAFVLNNAVVALNKKIPTTPPDAKSPAARRLVSLQKGVEDRAFASAAAGVGEIQITDPAKGMSWRSGKYQFAAVDGLVTIRERGMPLFDQQHAGGSVVRFTASSASGEKASKGIGVNSLIE